MVLLGWADDNLKWILLILSPIVSLPPSRSSSSRTSRDNQAASEIEGATLKIDRPITTGALPDSIRITWSSATPRTTTTAKS